MIDAPILDLGTCLSQPVSPLSPPVRLGVGVLSIVPNLLPLVALAAYLSLSHRRLQFPTVTLVTLALAFAVDDTIHVLKD